MRPSPSWPMWCRRTTFSAAQNLITKLDHETEVLFVGEPSGGKPNHYGDARRITLPESRLDVSISTLYWQDGGPFDLRSWVPPEIAVDLTPEDWVNGRDPVLEAALRADVASAGRPFEQLIEETFETNGFEAAMAVYEAMKKDAANRYIETETMMNRAGYFLLEHGMTEEAIRAFRLNVEAYPERWNAHDGLGEALAKAGRIEEAIRSYERSLELNPMNEAGAKILERLRSHGDRPHGK